MDIGNMDLALSALTSYDIGSSSGAGSLGYAVSTAVLGKSIDMTQEMGDAMVKMMEQSVTPGLGGNIDIRV